MSRGSQKKALIVGISDYTYLENLTFCKNDGTEVYRLLNSLGYEISDKNQLVGEAKGEDVKYAIPNFLIIYKIILLIGIYMANEITQELRSFREQEVVIFDPRKLHINIIGNDQIGNTIVRYNEGIITSYCLRKGS